MGPARSELGFKIVGLGSDAGTRDNFLLKARRMESSSGARTLRRPARWPASGDAGCRTVREVFVGHTPEKIKARKVA